MPKITSSQFHWEFGSTAINCRRTWMSESMCRKKNAERWSIRSTQAISGSTWLAKWHGGKKSFVIVRHLVLLFIEGPLAEIQNATNVFSGCYMRFLNQNRSFRIEVFSAVRMDLVPPVWCSMIPRHFPAGCFLSLNNLQSTMLEHKNKIDECVSSWAWTRPTTGAFKR